MKSKRCGACGQAFAPCSQAPNQTYCPERECQHERVRRRQRAKLATDPDYRDNQKRAQLAWADRHPDYCGVPPPYGHDGQHAQQA